MARTVRGVQERLSYKSRRTLSTTLGKALLPVTRVPETHTNKNVAARVIYGSQLRVTGSEPAVPTTFEETKESSVIDAKVRPERKLCVFRVAIVREKRRAPSRFGSE